MPESSAGPFRIEDGCVGIPVESMPAVLRVAWAQLQHCAAALGAGGQLLQEVGPLATRATLCILALNPDHHTAWNWRKRLLQHGYAAPSEELRLLSLLATYKRGCKSGLLWHHRRWVIANVVLAQPAPDLSACWSAEAEACAQSCDRYPRNYHCWAYRWWCFAETRARAALALPDGAPALDDKELAFAQAWVMKHPADYAAAHYFHLLAEAVCAPAHIQAVAQSELERSRDDLTSLYAGYESVWHHRRWCALVLSRHGCPHIAASEHAFLAAIQPPRGSTNAAAARLIANHAAWLAQELPTA
ncbi:Protein prenyltransferase alpha subunit repeat-containing protein 1 [Coemansia nantahalensis]|nr:Protein prenyltransferase alpha subunit repeat-containing protein 1 [Coemansia nantahalensis]